MTKSDPLSARRRLADLAIVPRELEIPWEPDLPAHGEPYEQRYPINDVVAYHVKMSEDERGRLVEWAVIQLRRDGAGWRRVAVYDTCHGKGIHVHYYNAAGAEVDQAQIRQVNGYKDLEEGLDYALKRVTESWQENERRG